MNYAKLDENNVVLQVIVADDNFMITQEGTWVFTDINGISPKNYAGKGYTYDSGRNAFIPVKEYSSWILNETTCRYEAPTSMPNDKKNYLWNEDQLQWIAI